MKKIALVSLLAFTLAGCGATLASIIATASTVLNYIATYGQEAQVVWNVIAPAIPAADQAKANADFTKAFTTMTTAEDALRQSLDVAQSATGPKPDIAADIAAVDKACQDVLAIVHQYGGSAGAFPGGKLSGVAPYVATLDAQAARIWSYR